jgi:uncharacterized membrane protein YedE/YeeE
VNLGPSSRSWSQQSLVFWAYLGVIGLLGQSIFRLVPIALEPLRNGPMTLLQNSVYWGWAVSSIYLEGYRGFHLRFVPRVIRRARLLAQEPTPLRGALAPLYVMGFFDAPPADKRAAWGVTTAVLCAVFVVRTLGQPWRGIIDGGVVMGLGAGMVSLIATAHEAFTPPRVSPDVAA